MFFLENFKPELPEDFRETKFVLLANIAPSLQLHVLEQMRQPRFVVADTMDLWIETTRKDLDALLPRIDLLILNDSEARQMTGDTSLIRAGRAIRRIGPKYVAVKKGEHGTLLSDRTIFSAAARIPWKTSTIRLGRAILLREGWQAIWPAVVRVK